MSGRWGSERRWGAEKKGREGEIEFYCKGGDGVGYRTMYLSAVGPRHVTFAFNRLRRGRTRQQREKIRKHKGKARQRLRGKRKKKRKGRGITTLNLRRWSPVELGIRPETPSEKVTIQGEGTEERRVLCRSQAPVNGA